MRLTPQKIAESECLVECAADAPQLSEQARAKCRDPGNEVYLSALSAWEIAIKHRLGRLPLPESPPQANGFTSSTAP